MTDGLSTLYQDLLGGSYDCVDRIVLNAYFRTGHDPGGFRLWWRALTGSDETLENAYLMRTACFWSWSLAPARRCGISAPITTSNESNRSPLSTTTRSTSATGTGAT